MLIIWTKLHIKPQRCVIKEVCVVLYWPLRVAPSAAAALTAADCESRRDLLLQQFARKAHIYHIS